MVCEKRVNDAVLFTARVNMALATLPRADRLIFDRRRAQDVPGIGRLDQELSKELILPEPLPTDLVYIP